MVNCGNIAPRANDSPTELPVTARTVEIFDERGHRLHVYTVHLGEEDCLIEEYEEAALILAERDGVVTATQITRCRARCTPH